MIFLSSVCLYVCLSPPSLHLSRPVFVFVFVVLSPLLSPLSLYNMSVCLRLYVLTLSLPLALFLCIILSNRGLKKKWELLLVHSHDYMIEVLDSELV